MPEVTLTIDLPDVDGHHAAALDFLAVVRHAVSANTELYVEVDDHDGKPSTVRVTPEQMSADDDDAAARAAG